MISIHILSLNSTFVKVRTRNCKGGQPGEGFCFPPINGRKEKRKCYRREKKFKDAKTKMLKARSTIAYLSENLTKKFV